MADGNPQKEEGYTAIAHEIVEHLAKVDLSPHETRLLMVVWRKTYGWKKKYDTISLTQFEKATGLDRKSVTRTLKKLEERRLVVVYRDGDRKTNHYGFNKKWKEWLGDKPADKLNTGSGSGAPTHRGRSAPTGVGATQPHTIETLKKDLTKESEDDQKNYPHDETTSERLEEAKRRLLNNMSL